MPTQAAHVVPPTEFSSAELDLLQSLAKRRDELDQRDAEIQQRESTLKVAEDRVGQKVNELNSLKSDIEKLLDLQKTKQDDQIQSLVKIYSDMKPQDAARIFNTLEMPVLLNVIGKMKEQKSAAIIAGMEPDRARELTTKLADLRQLPAGPAVAAPPAGLPTALTPAPQPRPPLCRRRLPCRRSWRRRQQPATPAAPPSAVAKADAPPAAQPVPTETARPVAPPMPLARSSAPPTPVAAPQAAPKAPQPSVAAATATQSAKPAREAPPLPLHPVAASTPAKAPSATLTKSLGSPTIPEPPIAPIAALPINLSRRQKRPPCRCRWPSRQPPPRLSSKAHAGSKDDKGMIGRLLGGIF